jgi:hypothetical protein
MSRTTLPRDRRGRGGYWWAVAAILVLVAAGFLTVGLRGHQHSLSGPSSTTAAPGVAPERMPSALGGTALTHFGVGSTTSTAVPTPESTSTAGSGPVDLQVARSTPVELNIPAIGVSVSLSQLGLNPDGTVQVPTDFQQPGWFQPGPSPGQDGSAVILGHVDSYQGPAIFFQLRSLVAGDQVDVTLADGVVAHFAVSTVAMYSKDQFPDQEVYGSKGYSALQLITCGGTFDNETGSYLSNIVAYTSLVSTTPAA